MKNAEDNHGYRNEILIYGGKEMVVSLWMVFNRMSRGKDTNSMGINVNQIVIQEQGQQTGNEE